MAIPSFNTDYKNGKFTKPRIFVLQIQDRNRLDQDAVAWLIVERQETHRFNEDGSINEASIRFTYECIRAGYVTSRNGKGHFSGSYSCGYESNPRVSLISERTDGTGAVFLDLPGLEGQGIGTYLMNEIVNWVKQWPSATVCTIALNESQARSESNKLRRNRFYEQFGLAFDYTDSDKKSGRSKSMTADELTPVEVLKDNLLEVSVDDFIMQLLDEKEASKREQGLLISKVNRLTADKVNAEKNPFKWIAHQIWIRILPYSGPFIFLSVIAYAIVRCLGWQSILSI
jgi:GNAT superfamily N-acetyltransferase